LLPPVFPHLMSAVDGFQEIAQLLVSFAEANNQLQ
jgi:hypothetical protein